MSEELLVAIFGGTFDPIHNGHLEVAKKAVAQLNLDQVIFIPCQRSPHKTEAPGADDHQRYTMVQLATGGMPQASTSDYEIQKPPPSFTWETIRHFKGQFPGNTRFFLLIGHDQWTSLPRWNKIETLRKEVEFIVVGRSGQPSPREGFRAHFIHGDHPASASEIRRDLAQGAKPQWLPPTVATYILEKDLYSLTP